MKSVVKINKIGHSFNISIPEAIGRNLPLGEVADCECEANEEALVIKFPATEKEKPREDFVKAMEHVMTQYHETLKRLAE